MDQDYSVTRKSLRSLQTGVMTSQRLTTAHIYTRDDLRNLFQISASSINTGIFKPAAFDSVWIFITEHKTADRTQYEDILTGDVLEMEGQSKGRTDHLIKEHVERGLELLLFYRKKKSEHPGAGFTFEGRFRYEGHEGSGPTKFRLRRESSSMPKIADIEAELQIQGEFDPDDLVDARKRTLASIVRRQGQRSFRKKLLEAYAFQCAVTGCTIESLLEAAHIFPYLGADTNVVSNGLLLRADIHTLFDLGLLWIDPGSLAVGIAAEIRESEYKSLEHKVLSLPAVTADQPSHKALQARLEALKRR